MNNYNKKLRQNMTDVEKMLWYRLRDRRFYGYKFRRQHVIVTYIVDFYCAERKLIIEVDGGQHDQQQKDRQRTAVIESLGYKIIRFWNNEVTNNLEGVLIMIKEYLEAPHPSPLPKYYIRERGN